MEKLKFNYLTANSYSDPVRMNSYGYKYTVGWLGSGMCQAYRTDEGFKRFMEVYNIKILYTEDLESVQFPDEKVTIYHFKPFTLQEGYFWNIDEVKDMNPFIALCNGSYVVCYYKHVKGGSIIMRPNPNAKNVYTELDYKEMAKIWG